MYKSENLFFTFHYVQKPRGRQSPHNYKITIQSMASIDFTILKNLIPICLKASKHVWSNSTHWETTNETEPQTVQTPVQDIKWYEAEWDRDEPHSQQESRGLLRGSSLALQDGTSLGATSEYNETYP